MSRNDELESARGFLMYTSAEIGTRLTTQYQLILAALTGLGVVLSQLDYITKHPLVCLALSVLYGMLGLVCLDHGRVIADLGSYRRKIENTLVKSNKPHNLREPWASVYNPLHPAEAIKAFYERRRLREGYIQDHELLGWEEYRKAHASKQANAAAISRYVPTFGAAIFFFAWFMRMTDGQGEYNYARTCLTVVLVILVIVTIIELGIMGRGMSKDEQR